MINKIYTHFYLIGICGVGMSQLAGLLKSAGYKVSGSDREFYQPIGPFLKSQNIQLFEGYKEENLNCNPDAVVIGNSVVRGNPEVERVLAEGKPFYSFCEVMRELFIGGKKCIVITGTHGKTTTTSLCSFVLDHCGMSPSFMVGGIPLNFLQGYQLREGNYFVIEGDEYDTSFFDKRAKFLHYLPSIVIINNIEFDHADIYEDLNSIKLQFKRLVNIIPKNGKLIINAECENTKEVIEKSFAPVENYGFSKDAYWRAMNISAKDSKLNFDVLKNGELYENFTINSTGKFNILNSLSVIAVSDTLNIPKKNLKSAISLFKGVKRRLEFIGQLNDIMIYDDFAHHPTAIHETISAVRLKHPTNRIFTIFEPRSWTARMNVFQDRFSDSFDGADKIILSKVYAQDKIPEEKRLNLETLIQDLKNKGKDVFCFESVEKIVGFCKNNVKNGDVILIMSNGGFDNIQEKLINSLKSKHFI